MNQQQLIIEEIKNRMEPHRYTIDFEYANTGYIRAIDPKTLLATRSVAFDFQKTRFDFKIAGTGDPRDYVAVHTYGQERRQGAIPAVKSTPTEAIDAIVAYLKGET